MSNGTKVPYLNLKLGNKEFSAQFHEALDSMLASGIFVMGEKLAGFEKQFARFCNVQYCAGVASGLDAITLSLKTLGIGKGDEVIVPSNTYIATLIAVTNVGATPILVEPNIDTYNIDPERIEGAITKKTKAIIPVHLYGQSCEMKKIMKIAQKRKLFVIEDNAQSHGSLHFGKKTGSFGIINATSFYPGKNFGALGDGGAVTTNKKTLIEKIKTLRNYGSRIKYYNDVIGYNSRLDELQAAFLTIKLKKLNEINKGRNRVAKMYIKGLTNVGDIVLPQTALHTTHVYHIFCIRSKKRKQLQAYLGKNGIQTLIHYPVPPHLQKAYRHLNYKKGDFPIAELLANTSLSLPMFPEMTDAQINYVITTIKGFYLQ